MDKPTILVVNPNTSEAMTVAIDRIAWEAAGTHANIVTRRSLQGPHTIEGPLDAALGVAGMLEVVGAYPYSFDAVVVACFGDPGGRRCGCRTCPHRQAQHRLPRPHFSVSASPL